MNFLKNIGKGSLSNYRKYLDFQAWVLFEYTGLTPPIVNQLLEKQAQPSADFHNPTRLLVTVQSRFNHATSFATTASGSCEHIVTVSSIQSWFTNSKRKLEALFCCFVVGKNTEMHRNELLIHLIWQRKLTSESEETIRRSFCVSLIGFRNDEVQA